MNSQSLLTLTLVLTGNEACAPIERLAQHCFNVVTRTCTERSEYMPVIRIHERYSKLLYSERELSMEALSIKVIKEYLVLEENKVKIMNFFIAVI